MMKITENNLLGAVNELRAKGFNDEFLVEKNTVKSTKTGKVYSEDDFIISHAYRFDITENAVDTQNLYVIETADGKGLLIDILGNYLYTPNLPGAANVGNTVESYVCEDQPMKYGMEKIYKARFDENPGRYELRRGFPDFPACPFGNSFSMLGYDKTDKKYVWLVTSILRDKRLQEVHYQS
jgi:hypothetical protein